MKNTLKKLMAILLTLVIMLPVSAIGAFADNAATTETPVYTPNANWCPNDDGIFVISTPEDLLALSAKRGTYGSYSGKTVVLANDIDLNPGWDASSRTAATNLWDCGKNFYFNGTFDGQGHTIRGFCQISNGGNASFCTLGANITSGETIFKNLKIENSYFCSKAKEDGTAGAASFISAARGPLVFENVYMDIICESAQDAAGFVCGTNCTSANLTPSITLRSCIFVGSVDGKLSAGAFVAKNNRGSDNLGKGTYRIDMIDCVNYGKVVCADPTKGAALVGNCANTATFTRCFNAGEAGSAFVNMGVSDTENLDKAPVTITFNDCYYVADKSIKAITNSAEKTTYTVNYDGAAANDFKTATVAEIVEKTAFKASDEYKGWKMDASNTYAMPYDTALLVGGHEHDYETAVTAPTCAEKGFTTKTCKICGQSSVSDYVDKLEHVPGDTWIIDKEPTEEYAGMRHLECTLCGESLNPEILPALGVESDTDTEPADSVADSADDTTPDTTPEENGGCGSAIGASVVLVAMSVLGTAVISKKRK